MDISAALAADLTTLTRALDDPGIDLKTQLQQLTADVRHAVASYLGMRMTIAVDGTEVSFTVHHATGSIAASLRLPLAAFSPTETGSNLVLYAATPGAFIDLAADLSYALGLPPAALPTDDDLTVPVSGSGITGLNSQSTINQALGVLIDLGHTPESGRQELNRLAVLDSGQFHDAAEAILRSVTRPPNNGDQDDVASGGGRRG
jgi:hypothetical protein